MCDHHACAPITVDHLYLERWVNQCFEMVTAIRRGLLSIEALYRVTSPTLARECILHAAITPIKTYVKIQQCKAEFLALCAEDPPALTGSVTTRDGQLRIIGLQILPRRRF
ncbi:hypothetical protein [Stomatohabitans albus]|uniref:hypothetical protein n=1 Tax=Stomatohabitans albus TaxID=3110766 RepID=UPI00300C4630